MDESANNRELVIASRLNARRPSLLGRAVRLGMGGVALGVTAVQGQVRHMVGYPGPAAESLREPQSQGEPSAQPTAVSRVVDRALSSAVGAAVIGEEAARRSVMAIWNANKRVWEATAPLRRPLDAWGVTDLAFKPVETLAARVEPAITRLQEAGSAELTASRNLTLATITDIVDTIVAYLTHSPAVEALIRTQVDRLLPELAEHPAVHALVQRQVALILPELAEDMAIHQLIRSQVELILPALADDPAVRDLIHAQLAQVLPALKDDPLIQELIQAQAEQYLLYLQEHPDTVQALIRSQGDTYIDYLNEHPDAVQTLVSGQSLGIAGQVMDEVRERTVTADSVAEMLVRSLLRKKPRYELEEPPAAVQRRAAVAVLPSDYVQRKENADGAQ